MKNIFKYLFLFIICSNTIGVAQNPPGSVVSHLNKENGKYVGSPGLCILPDGSYLASHDEFGPKSSEFSSAQTRIFSSKDKGKTWKQLTVIDGQFWSNLFVHKDKVYIIGTNKHHGNFIIRRSDDGGHTWTIPYHSKNGLLLPGEYHTAPVPVIIHKGRIWRALEYATAPSTKWGERYSAMMISASVNDNLLDAKRWRKTNHLMFDASYLNGEFRGWLEGNAVVGPDGLLRDILRVDAPNLRTEYAAIITISKNGKKASFNPDTDFVKLPGGTKKFTIRYDEQTHRYWMLSNYVKKEWRDRNFAWIRNTLALSSSTDLKNWTVHKIILDHKDAYKHAFQYVEWQFEGNDIILLSRTAYDDENGPAQNNHDANFLTFHRIPNFRLLVNEVVEK